eukprot:5430207-Prymnesium_polylepis.1
MRVEPHLPDAAVRDDHERDICVTLGGGAWAACSFLGLVQYLQSTFDAETLERWAFCGESAGGVFALALCLGVPHDHLQQLHEVLVRAVGAHPFGIAGRGLELAGALVDEVLNWVSEEEL